MNTTQKVARYIFETKYDQFAKEVIERSKLCLLDWIAVTLAGSGAEVSQNIFQTIKLFGGKKQATILGMQTKTSLPFAALINGTASHALDYDDVYIDRSGHPSAPVIPAILSISEWKGLSGKNFIEALVVGIHVEYAIGEGVLPQHYEQGWHNTATIGHFGAAAGVSKLLHLNREKIVYALGIAATQAAGLRQMFGTMCKPLHAGKAAMNGLLSGLWAQAGMNSSDDGLGEKLGFLMAYSSKPNPQKMIESLFGECLMSKVRFKDYPSCRSTHTVIDGMVELKKKHSFDIGQVKEINLGILPRSLVTCRYLLPQTALEGKFSLTHCAAAALVEGPLYYSHFTDEKMSDPVISNLREKVKLLEDNSLEIGQSRISVTLESGKKYDFFSDIYSPDKEKDLGERLADKTKNILEPLIGKKKTIQLIESVENLERSKDLSTIIHHLV